MMDYLIPLLMLLVSAVALGRKCDVYSLLAGGARDGLKVVLSITPALIILLTAVHMLRASGAFDLLGGYLSPLFNLFGIPTEVAPLLLLRPISGSAALAMGADLIATYGPDSLVGRTAAVILGSTETTFYAVSVYFSAAGVRKTRYTLPAALLADMTAFFVACFSVRLIF